VAGEGFVAELGEAALHAHGHARPVQQDAGLEALAQEPRNLERADATNERIKATIDQYIAREGIGAPVEPPYQPPWQPTAPRAELSFREAGVSALVWCMGFALDYRFLELPVLDPGGYPQHDRGVTPVPGLYFLGLPWQYTWGSGRFCGVGRDAEYLAQRIADRAGRLAPATAPFGPRRSA
jgi:putative flavoprotein involved in K+ transport